MGSRACGHSLASLMSEKGQDRIGQGKEVGFSLHFKQDDDLQAGRGRWNLVESAASTRNLVIVFCQYLGIVALRAHVGSQVRQTAEQAALWREVCSQTLHIGHRSRPAAIRGAVVAEVPGIGRPRRKRLSK